MVRTAHIFDQHPQNGGIIFVQPLPQQMLVRLWERIVEEKMFDRRGASMNSWPQVYAYIAIAATCVVGCYAFTALVFHLAAGQ